jgi:hypothetical protein
MPTLQNLAVKMQRFLESALWIGMLVAIILFILLVITSDAKSHSWYPPECCGEYDCDIVINMEMLPDGSRKVTTKHGTSIFPKDFPVRETKDPAGAAHACFTPYDLNERGDRVNFCLFLGTGS